MSLWHDTAQCPEARATIEDPTVSHREAARLLRSMGFPTTERSVRRARQSNRQVMLVLSDWQVDLHDEGFLWRVYNLAKDVRPTIIAHVGDESDNTTVGRWVQGAPEEIEGDLQEQLDITHDWLARFRSIPSVVEMGVCSSNHGLRFEKSIRSRIPAFRHLRCLRYENLLGLGDIKVDYHVGLWEPLPGVVCAHGDQWGLTSKSQYSKLTEVSQVHGKSVIAGHTHRPLLSTVADGDGFSRFIMNVGHSMDLNRAEYMGIDRGGLAQWGQGVAVVEYDGVTAHPELIVERYGRMQWRGKLY